MPRAGWDRFAIEAELGRRLEAAHFSYERASEELNRITRESPSGLPTPDAALRLQEAGRVHGEALKTYHLALSRFNDFILRGSIPEDL